MKLFLTLKKRLPFPYWLFILIMFWPFFLWYFVFAKFLSRPGKQIGLRTVLAMILAVGILALITYLNEKSDTDKVVNQSPPTIATPSSIPTMDKQVVMPETKQVIDQRDLQVAKVLLVIDGDTIEVEVNGKTEKIRMIGVDTPEVVDPRKPVQCFGKEASNYSKSVLTDKTVWLEADPSQGERDKYGRLLRFVWIDNAKTDFNKQLIAEGFAHEYTYNVPYKYREDYLASERMAEQNNLGLWNRTTCPVESKVTPTTKIVTSGNCQYSCSGPDKDCGDFKTRAQAQTFFECCGFSADFDPMKLDNAKARGNGRACESLP